MREKLKEYLKVCNIVSLLMFVTLFFNWFNDWAKSDTIPTETAFRVAKDYKIIWVIIICTIIALIAAILIVDIQLKTKALGILAFINIVICIISRFTVIGDEFESVSLGWYIMLILCLIQIGYAVSHNKKEVSQIIENKISKI